VDLNVIAKLDHKKRVALTGIQEVFVIVVDEHMRWIFGILVRRHHLLIT
jgi:hypothetical protein